METLTNKHIDLTYLKKLSNGSNPFMIEMISVFIQQTPTEIESMEKSLKNKDWKSLRATSHKMKPSLAFMGIKELEGEIKLVEDYASTETNLDLLPEKLTKIKNICTEAIKELEIEKKMYL